MRKLTFIFLLLSSLLVILCFGCGEKSNVSLAEFYGDARLDPNWDPRPLINTRDEIFCDDCNPRWRAVMTHKGCFLVDTFFHDIWDDAFDVFNLPERTITFIGADCGQYF